jgi:hypothetical protein
MDTRTPIPANYYVLQLRRTAYLVGASRTTCFSAYGPLQLLFSPLDTARPVLKELHLDLEGGHIVFVAVFPLKGNSICD